MAFAECRMKGKATCSQFPEGRNSHKHYNPWVRSRQEQLDSEKACQLDENTSVKNGGEGGILTQFQ
jgi:hypothetical protein